VNAAVCVVWLATALGLARGYARRAPQVDARGPASAADTRSQPRVVSPA
jgi:hypothetical protein